ncbi:MAG: SDR family NAD(P)-dependent oxidoreductase [Leptolyngbyaceae cyanobacterium]
MSRNLLVVGGSRGIGAAVAKHFSEAGDRVFSVSRTPAAAGQWIRADMAIAVGIEQVAIALQGVDLDALLFMGGVWEAQAFTEQYDFLASPDVETRFVLAVNAIAPIELTKQLVGNLQRSVNPRAIYIGALSGLDHCPSVEVANTASKFALRGAVQALRLALQGTNIGFTVINPGNIATAEVVDDIQAGRFAPQVAIPLTDLISAIDWLLSLSSAVDVSEVNFYQKR